LCFSLTKLRFFLLIKEFFRIFWGATPKTTQRTAACTPSCRTQEFIAQTLFSPLDLQRKKQRQRNNPYLYKSLQMERGEPVCSLALRAIRGNSSLLCEVARSALETPTRQVIFYLTQRLGGYRGACASLSDERLASLPDGISKQ
jgi:hypothetical protein